MFMLDPETVRLIGIGAGSIVVLLLFWLWRRNRRNAVKPALAAALQDVGKPTTEDRQHDRQHRLHVLIGIFVNLMVSVLSFNMTYKGLLADLSRITGLTVANQLEALHTALVISFMIAVTWSMLFAVSLYRTNIRAFTAIFVLGLTFLGWTLKVDGEPNFSSWAGAPSEVIYRSEQLNESEARLKAFIQRARFLPGMVTTVRSGETAFRSSARLDKTSGALSGSAGEGAVYATFIALADRANATAQRLEEAQRETAAVQARAEELLQLMRRILADRKTDVWARVDSFLEHSFEFDALLRRLEGLDVNDEISDYFALMTASVQELGSAGQSAALRAEKTAMSDRAKVVEQRVKAITAIEIPEVTRRSDATFSEVLWANYHRFGMYLAIAFGIEFVPFFIFTLLMLQKRPGGTKKRTARQEKAVLIGKALPRSARPADKYSIDE